MALTKKAILAERKKKTIQHMMTSPKSAIPVMGFSWDDVIGIKYKSKTRTIVIEICGKDTLVKVEGPLLKIENTNP